MKEPGQIAWEAACAHYGIEGHRNPMPEAKRGEFAAIEAAVIEECAKAISRCGSLDENGYIVEKSAAIAAIRALTNPSPAAPGKD